MQNQITMAQRWSATDPNSYCEPGPDLTKHFAWWPTRMKNNSIIWFRFYFIRKQIIIEGSGKMVWFTEFLTPEETLLHKLKGK